MAESHVKVPQLDFTTFEPLPGSISSPTGTDVAGIDRQGSQPRPHRLGNETRSDDERVGGLTTTGNTDIEQLM